MGLKDSLKSNFKRPSLILLFAVVSFLLIFLLPWLGKLPKYGGDWHYLYNQNLVERAAFPSLWQQSENLGASGASAADLSPLYTLAGYVYKTTGTGFSSSESLIWFIPFLAFSFGGMFLLSRKLLGKNQGSVLAGLFYALNTYTLTLFAEAGHINILVAYALMPLVILALLKLLQDQKPRNMIIFSIIFTLQAIYDIRISFISLILQLCFVIYYLLHNRSRRSVLKTVKSLAISAGLFLLLNLFWIVPVLMVPGGDLFEKNQNDPSWLTRLSYQQISNGIFPQHPFWTLTGITYFSPNEVLPMFYFFTFFVLAGIILVKKKATLRTILVLIIVWLAGIFLVKGVNPPLGEIYSWLFSNFPGFVMFREPQKFYVLVFFPFALLSGIALKAIYQAIAGSDSNHKKLLSASISFLYIVVFTISLLPAYTGQLGGSLKARALPEYAAKVEKIVSENPGSYRTMWIPQITSSSYGTEANPQIDASYLLNQYFETDGRDPEAIFNQIGTPAFNYFAGVNSVRYIVFPQDPESLRWFKTDFRSQIASFKENPEYKLINENGYFIFEKKSYQPLIYASVKPVVSDSNAVLTGIPAELNPGRMVILAGDGNQLDRQTYSAANAYFDLSSGTNISTISTGKISGIANLPQNDLFTLSENDGNRYFQAEFKPAGSGRYQLSLVPAAEQLTTDGHQFDTTEKKEIKTGLLTSPQAAQSFLVGLNGDYIAFSKDELTAGKPKGILYLADTEQNKISLYNANPDTYLLEQFDQPKTYDIGDCNNFDSKSLEQAGISYQLSQDRDQGDSSLLIKADVHKACFSKTMFANPEDEVALLSVDYKNIQGDLPSLCVFDNQQSKCALSLSLADASKEQWNSVQKTFPLNKGSKTYSLFLYANADDQRSINLYDNAIVTAYNQTGEVSVSGVRTSRTIADQVFFKGIANNTEYSSPAISEVRLANASFEDTLNYQLNAKDCNNIDKSPLGTNKIQVQQTEDATDGRFALQLSGEKHAACIDLDLGSLSPNYTYYLSFDYKAGQDTLSRFCVIGDSSDRCLGEQELPDATDWTDRQFPLVPQDGSPQSYKLYLYSYTQNPDQPLNYSTVFDKIRLFAVPRNYNDRFVLIRNEARKYAAPEISYQKINAAKYVVTAENVAGPFFLELGNTYSDGWEAKIVEGNGYVISHFRTNKLDNGFYIESGSGLKIELEYKYQSLFQATVITSSVVFILAAILLLTTFLVREPKNYAEA